MIVSQNNLDLMAFNGECLGQIHQKQVMMEPLKQDKHPKY